MTGSEGIEFNGESRAGIYAWTERLLVAQEFMRQSKKRRGAIRRYARKVTGLSLPQITLLIRSYVQTGTVELRVRASLRCRFAGKYTDRDVTLLAEVDRAHERLSGPATQRILKREHEEYGKAEYGRLAGISVSHIYNLRNITAARVLAGWGRFRRAKPMLWRSFSLPITYIMSNNARTVMPPN